MISTTVDAMDVARMLDAAIVEATRLNAAAIDLPADEPHRHALIEFQRRRLSALHGVIWRLRSGYPLEGGTA